MRFDWPIKSFFIEGIKADYKTGKFCPEKFINIGPQEFLNRIRKDVRDGRLKPAEIITGEHTNPHQSTEPRLNFPVGYKKAHRVRPDFKQKNRQ